jgi:caffeoyl-CoA O-methyltransferase
MDLINPNVQKYAENYSSPEDDFLKEVSVFTDQHPEAHMCSGYLQGKVLEMFSCMMRPERILEIGTFTGQKGSLEQAVYTR